MNRALLSILALLGATSTFADSNLICGVYKGSPVGSPAIRLVSNLDANGDNAVMVNSALRFSVFINNENVHIGFSRMESAAKTVFSGSKRVLKSLDAAKGESIGWIDTIAPVGGTQTDHYGICYFTGNDAKAPFDP